MIGRRATLISHPGSTGARRRVPAIGRLALGVPANDNPPPHRPLRFRMLVAAGVFALVCLVVALLAG